MITLSFVNRLINRVPPDAEESILLAVVNIFSKGGRWNWANVIILFYFGYGLCKRVSYDVTISFHQSGDASDNRAKEN